MFANVIVALSLLATVSATPFAELARAATQSDQNPCDGGRSYCGWFDKENNIPPSCKCLSGQNWDDSGHSCTFPPLPEPSCDKNKQKVICAKDKDHTCDYDASNSLCSDDGTNIVIVIDINITIEEAAPTIEQACAQPNCAAGQSWDDKEKKCKFPPLPKKKADSCQKKGGQPVCARTPQDYCPYDQDQDDCQDDGINCLQCVESGQDIETVLESVFATLDVAVNALGFNCLCNNVGCVLTDAVWSLLCVVCDVTGIVCSLLGGLLGLC